MPMTKEKMIAGNGHQNLIPQLGTACQIKFQLIQVRYLSRRIQWLQSITGIRSLGFSGGDLCAISDASSSLARELLIRFDTGQHCSTSFAAGFSTSSPALPVSQGAN